MIANIRRIACILLPSGALAFAQGSGAPPDNFSGMWLVQDPGSGNFEDGFANVPQPELRAEIIEDNKKWEESARAGNIVNTARRLATCPVGNLPLMMTSSPALNIVAAKEEVLIGAESNHARFIYTDGRDHSEVTSARVADTTGFNDRGATRIPDGGVRTPASHLVERYRLLDGGDRLWAIFTWDAS